MLRLARQTMIESEGIMETYTAYAERGSDFFCTTQHHDAAHKAVSDVLERMGVEWRESFTQTPWKYNEDSGCVKTCTLYDTETGDEVCTIERRA